MHAINLIASAVRKTALPPRLPEEPKQQICCLTGASCECIPVRHILSNTFTNYDLLRAPQSAWIGVDVWVAWMYGYFSDDTKKREMRPERMSCWWTDGEIFRQLKRAEVRELVLNPQYTRPWAGYVTTSYKKHGSLVASVNVGRQNVWAFEMRTVDCSDVVRVGAWWNRLNEALRAGLGRSILETLDCPTFVMRKIGVDIWVDFQTWARDKYQSALYSFLCYLLPSKAELDAEKPSMEQKEITQMELAL